ncbi:MAG TPA: DedA family protein [Catenuloplanes sp.]
MHYVEAWLATLPAISVYLIVGLIIGIESMGVPLPGEITLVSAALLAASTGSVDPLWIAVSASTGAIVGDSIGYAIGRRGGRPLLERLGRRFPAHLGPDQLARGERLFARWGVWAVFFGRFVALLRILAGPMAGALKVPYRRFLVANATGGLVWAFGTVYLLFYLGRTAEAWLKGVSWWALGISVVCGIATTWWLRRRARGAMRAEAGRSADSDAATPPVRSGAATPPAPSGAATPPAAAVAPGPPSSDIPA